MPVTELAGFLMRRPASAGGAYSIARSLRFNSADSAYLSRTPGSSGTRTKWTLSFWAKRASFAPANNHTVFGAGSSSSEFSYVAFVASNDTFIVGHVTGGADNFRVRTNRVFRDPSAWYHIVVAFDSTLGTSTDRIKIWVNGVQETSMAETSYPSSSYAGAYFGHNVAQEVGRSAGLATRYYDGYLAEVFYIDGTALTPSTFGQTDSTTGAWVPKQVTGVTYGTNGFWLSFYDNTSTTTLGRDDAGGAAGAAAGSNDWTLNNFSVTAGVGNDSLTDTPTNNYPTLSPLTNINAATLANGNLYTAATSASGNVVRGTQTIPAAGLVYFEATFVGTVGSGTGCCGIIDVSTAHTSSPTSLATVPSTMWLWRTDGYKVNAGSSSAHGSITSGQVFQCAVDRANNKVWFGANGTWFGSGDPAAGTNASYTNLTGDIAACVNFQGTSGSPTWEFNFGQRPFAHTPPTGFSALCTSNLSTPSIVKPNAYFDVDTYTSNGSGRTKTGLGFQPDLAWFKNRTGTGTDHAIYDAVRGVQKQLESNQTGAETTETTGLTAFNSDGYTIGTLAQLNTNTATYVSWLWKEGVTPGLDIVTYTGGGAGTTVAHSLGVAPALIIQKCRNTSGQVTAVYHKDRGATKYLDLSGTAAEATLSTVWNNSTPTSSSFQLGGLWNNTYTFVAYLFAEVSGFSRIGSYTGNGSADGPFVHCGFRPRFVMVKRTDTTGDWYIWDTARDTINPAVAELLANTTATEAGTADLDPLSNGFKLRATTAGFNASGGTYLFAAFAEFPFKYANAR